MTIPDPDLPPVRPREAARVGARFLEILARLAEHDPQLAAGVRRRRRNGERLARAAQGYPAVRLDSRDCARLESAHAHLVHTVLTTLAPALIAPILGLRPAGNPRVRAGHIDAA